MASVEPKYHEILIRLADEQVEFIVVGMAATVLQGVPVTTWDLDIVPGEPRKMSDASYAFSGTSKL